MDIKDLYPILVERYNKQLFNLDKEKLYKLIEPTLLEFGFTIDDFKKHNKDKRKAGIDAALLPHANCNVQLYYKKFDRLPKTLKEGYLWPALLYCEDHNEWVQWLTLSEAEDCGISPRSRLAKPVAKEAKKA